ncbi:hypothetical protein [Burkholderia vietnamiensis]|uniref:hypothetical protein n=1 Tax=Burkholderia vietnamiensis TaxID=60552 RepID=UPI001CF54E6F|nr:hypothetical protein [Burkholderia vietnamiensis]MCA8229111.1 hypothetical protein [Burkholderia vietnamiensis]MCO1351431.1 hypothetical protein [Burkholderia vietnamiensis]MCO1433365.1 hypothetical protein [Burkholderia vietnamiensis]MDN8075849.1 hypothetical protein [Burkholderia vietnamiensis]UQN48870.1 hypothetical protein L0Y95_16200 [Burkholderia vietnamiensis]
MKARVVVARVTALALAAALAAAVAPAFARGQPQLPDDDGGRASVLAALNPQHDATPERAVAGMGSGSAATGEARVAHAHAAPIKRAPSAMPRADTSALAAR